MNASWKINKNNYEKLSSYVAGMVYTIFMITFRVKATAVHICVLICR